MDKERLIEKYLHKELTDQDLKSLNQLLDSDQDFKDEFELRTILYADYKTTIKQDLLNSIPKGVQNENKNGNENENENKPPFLKFAIAALLAILAAMAIYYASSKAKTSVSSTQIIAQYLDESSRYPTVTKDDTVDASNPWSVAKKQFIANDYEQFLEIINPLDLTEEQQYYKGLALAYQKVPSYETAIQTLLPISNNHNSRFKEEADWFLALFYLKNNQEQEGKGVLQQIISSQAWKHKEAAILLNTLAD